MAKTCNILFAPKIVGSGYRPSQLGQGLSRYPKAQFDVREGRVRAFSLGVEILLLRTGFIRNRVRNWQAYSEWIPNMASIRGILDGDFLLVYCRSGSIKKRRCLIRHSRARGNPGSPRSPHKLKPGFPFSRE